ncbi:MAG: hypothetical protein V4792_20665 [Pseudomonadota bacterium]
MTTSTLPQGSLPALAAIVDLQLQRLMNKLLARSASAKTPYTHDTAASLYARAAHYEATQPGFAADLRAAAEAMDRQRAA